MAAPNVCTYNKYGYCKYKEICRKQHVNEKCENSSCDIQTCNLRHPITCKFFRKYNYCKFNPCAFLHVEKDSIEKLGSENKNMQKRFDLLEEKLDKALETINCLDKFNTLENIIHQKDLEIETLKKKD